MGEIINNRVVAVMGVSEDPSKYGNKIFKTLAGHKVKVYGVNKNGGTVIGQQIYKELSELPVKPQFVIMVVPPVAAMGIVQDCIKLGVEEIWFQPGTQNDEAIKLANDNGIKTTANACIMVKDGYW
ncbi:hypothetical protein Dip510_001136 [Elusimicrobium posterum]|uniref:CoA-binding protein n=1 Tax=Elusimicrobium posterum TaxID=3116653 RepID=UPI003C7663B9